MTGPPEEFGDAACPSARPFVVQKDFRTTCDCELVKTRSYLQHQYLQNHTVLCTNTPNIS